VRADKESIRQVLINLVHNSIKYGREGGVTKVSLYDMETLYLLLEVSDNGHRHSARTPAARVRPLLPGRQKPLTRRSAAPDWGSPSSNTSWKRTNKQSTCAAMPGKGSTFGLTLEKA
jgi:two-component system phosphate regulon sensor histidine kinase PhoR